MKKKSYNKILLIVIVVMGLIVLGTGAILVGSLVVKNVNSEEASQNNSKKKEEEEAKIKIVIEWDGRYSKKDELIDLTVILKGTMGDGSEINLDSPATDAYDSKGKIVGTMEKTVSDKKGTITIKLYNTDGVFSIEGKDGKFDPEQWNNEISSVDAQATVYEGDAVITVLKSESGLYRSYTGVWFWGICGVNNGELTEYDATWLEEGYESLKEVKEETDSTPTEIMLSKDAILGRVEEIRVVYYGIENNISSYEVEDGGSGTVRYLKDGKICKIVAKPSSYTDQGYDEKYTAQYYYDDNQVVFVFVFCGDEEYRFYMDSENCQKVIRYIDSDGIIHDYQKGADANDISPVGYYCGLAMQELHWAGVLY